MPISKAMDITIYGRISKQIDGKYTLETFDATLMHTYHDADTIAMAEEYFHWKHPTGYIIPDWLGV